MSPGAVPDAECSYPYCVVGHVPRRNLGRTAGTGEPTV
jgi:hypothetical protein